MDSQTNTGGGASLGGNANTGGGNFVGRDMIINIMTVGRLLEFAEVQNLLPRISNQLSFTNVRDAIDSVFDDNHNNLVVATAFAGEMLKDILADWISSRTGLHISLRKLIVELAKDLYKNLKLSGYWDMHRQLRYGSWDDFDEILYFDSTAMLWKEELYEINVFFGLVYENEFNIYFIKDFKPFKEVVEEWSTREQRLFLVGIVLDLIRIRSEDTLNLHFLRELVNSLEEYSSIGKKHTIDSDISDEDIPF